MTEDEMAGWHHELDGCEFEQAPGVGDGQGGLASVHGIFQARVLEWGASSFSDKFYKITGIRKEVKNVQYFILTYISSKMFSVILSCTNHLLTFCF